MSREKGGCGVGVVTPKRSHDVIVPDLKLFSLPLASDLPVYLNGTWTNLKCWWEAFLVCGLDGAVILFSGCARQVRNLLFMCSIMSRVIMSRVGAPPPPPPPPPQLDFLVV